MKRSLKKSMNPCNPAIIIISFVAGIQSRIETLLLHSPRLPEAAIGIRVKWNNVWECMGSYLPPTVTESHEFSGSFSTKILDESNI